jgi:serine/threonine protein kinase
MSEGSGASSGDNEVATTTPASARMAAGKRVGRYEIIRQIGRGGMATVYLARQETINREVALKELSSFHASSPDMVQRFLRESQLAGSLNHPNIVTVLEYFEDDGLPYIAMEYVRRGSLRPYVGKLGLAQFVGVMEGVLAGLAHAETQGIVHRDLKPENLMVTADGRVKITDFGIAKATLSAGTVGVLTIQGTTVGTPNYMAPEQAMGQEVGGWTDLYSVGIMAWEHAVGRVPFYDSEVPLVILTRQLNERIPAAIEVNSEADPHLSDWIDRLLVKDPSARVRSAADAWDDLEDIVLRKLGARWRREARLPSPSQVFETPKPLTPAPFESQQAKTPEPGAQTAPRPRGESGYVTFGRPAEREPTPAPAEVPEAESPAAPVEAPAADVKAPVAETPVAEPPVPPEPAPDPTPPPDSTPPPAASTYVTFGAAGPQPVVEESHAPETAEPSLHDAPVVPVETEEPKEPEEIDEIDEPDERTVAPSTVPAPPEPDAHAAEPPEAVEPEPEPEPEPAEPDAATPTPEPAPARRRPPAGAAVAVLLGAAIIAGVVGFLIAPSSGGSAAKPEPLAQQATAGPVAFAVPAAWRRVNPPTSPVNLSDAVAYAAASPSGGTLVVGTTKTTGPSLLPDALVSAVGSLPTRQVVSLGSAGRFYRYLSVSPSSGGGPANVYAQPTTNGVVIAACLLAGGGTGFPGACERSIGTIRLSSGTALPLGPSASFASALSGVIGQLNSSVGRDAAQLRAAKKPGDQASAASRLASAYRAAGAATAKLTPPPGASSAVAALAAALKKTGGDYAALAAAASHSDGGAYNAARASIGADTGGVSSAVSNLAQLGYAAS